MEFRNCVVGAIRFLVSVLREVSHFHEDDCCNVRLAEAIQWLNMDTLIWERDRRVRLASAYASRILAESELFPRPRRVHEVIAQLRSESELLETALFFSYGDRTGDEAKRMEVVDKVGCHIGGMCGSILDLALSCRRGELPCEVVGFLGMQAPGSLLASISNEGVKVKDKRLREGAKRVYDELSSGSLPSGVSIGQRLCHPVGDCVLVGKAGEVGVGILTGDRDQVRLATVLGIPRLFYDAKSNVVS